MVEVEFVLSSSSEVSVTFSSNQFEQNMHLRTKPEDHWSCVAHLSVEDMLKSAGFEEKSFKII